MKCWPFLFDLLFFCGFQKDLQDWAVSLQSSFYLSISSWPCTSQSTLYSAALLCYPCSPQGHLLMSLNALFFSFGGKHQYIYLQVFFYVWAYFILKMACKLRQEVTFSGTSMWQRAPWPGLQPWGHPVMLTNHNTTSCWVWAKPGEAAGVAAVSQHMCPASTVSVWPHSGQRCDNRFCPFCDCQTHFCSIFQHKHPLKFPLQPNSRFYYSNFAFARIMVLSALQTQQSKISPLHQVRAILNDFVPKTLLQFINTRGGINHMEQWNATTPLTLSYCRDL